MEPGWAIILGLGALVGGAEMVVRHGAHLARGIGVPPILVGLTIVSIGTSAPELAVGIDAFRNDAGSLAIGNIAGTNIVNLLLILGLTAAIRPLVLQLQTLRVDLPMMAGAALLTMALAADRMFTVLDGVILLLAAVGYTAVIAVRTRRENQRVVAEFEHGYPAEPRGRVHAGLTLLRLLLLVIGIAVIVIGAQWLVDGATGLAVQAGVTDAVIGLTIVAIGTSAPELATTLISTFRGDRDIAVGNLIGSSTYNLTLILGASLLFTGAGAPIDPALVWIDLPIMTAVALLCVPVFLTGLRVSRAEGIAFVTGYAIYLGVLLIVRA